MRYALLQGAHRAGSNRVIRGGSWNNNAGNCRAANRNNAEPGNRNDNLGFRLLSTGPWPEVDVYGRTPRAQGTVQVGDPTLAPGQLNSPVPRRLVGCTQRDGRRGALG